MSGDASQPPGEGPASGAADAPVGDVRVRRPFLVQVASLRKAVGTTKDVDRAGPLADLAAVSVSVPGDAPVRARLALASYPGGLMVTGTVTAPWVGECRRCGGPVEGEVTAEVRERYAPGGGTARDEDAYPLEGDELDLEPLVRDAVLLDLPLAPLCDPTCLGLCPTCGANRNLDPCGCAAPADPRWSALDALREG